jgi:hypothetical protein
VEILKQGLLMIRASTISYFLVVTPSPFWVRAGFAVIVLLGCWTVALNPRDVDTAFANILLLQMFAVSNGLSTTASRGHLDPLLVSGRSRPAIVGGNAVAAAVPGLLAWMAVLVMAGLVGEGALTRALAPHRLVALFIVSGCAWAVGTVLPRLAAGALWMLLLVGFAISRGAFGHLVQMVEAGPSGLLGVLASALTCLVCPLLFLSDYPGARDPRVVALAAGLAWAVIAVAVWHLSRRDYTLRETA